MRGRHATKEGVFLALLYLLIGLGATIIGSLAGFGGGILIKPILDFLGHYDLKTIGFLSASTVFAMAIVSVYTRRRMFKDMRVDHAVLLAVGSILGGIFGKGIFQMFSHLSWIGMAQTGALIIIFSAVLYYVNHKHQFKQFHIESRVMVLLIGLILGLMASFLDIGGGPHNVAILSLLFAFDTKKAGFYSIFIIFFSQLASLVSTMVSGALSSIDLSMLLFMVIGGISGGVIGSRLAKFLAIETVEKVFNVTIFLLILLNIYNFIQYMA